MTKNKIKKAVLSVLGIGGNVDDLDPSIQSAMILMASGNVGPNAKRIAKLLGYPRKVVAEKARIARKNKIWVGGKIIAEWLDDKRGGVAFIADVAVLDGILERVFEPSKNP